MHEAPRAIADAAARGDAQQADDEETRGEAVRPGQTDEEHHERKDQRSPTGEFGGAKCNTKGNGQEPSWQHHGKQSEKRFKWPPRTKTGCPCKANAPNKRYGDQNTKEAKAAYHWNL